ncbi:MAG: sodium-dependent bicarbonate transport family permease [Blastochloris sp.]|nr:sodium-dependent bicarbonate transport family permease [Blastochloris sp.]
MSTDLLIANLLSPPILFFALGLLAVLFKSDLEIPSPIPKFLSLYLLFAIGFHGGGELRHSELSSQVVWTLLAAMMMAAMVPLYTFYVARWKMDVYNAAAVAATYGSISAVTFITADSYLQALAIPYGGHMVAAMALMESPAIVIGVVLARIYGKRENTVEFHWNEVFKDAFLNGSVFLLMGSLLIGYITTDTGHASLDVFSKDIFKGVLSFFLLDMGLVAARRIGDLKKLGWTPLLLGLGIPLFSAVLALGLCLLLGLDRGNALMFTVLCASGSYIAVPAAMRLAVPEANPSLYVPMALAITFPFNILIGIPLYLRAIDWLKI